MSRVAKKAGNDVVLTSTTREPVALARARMEDGVELAYTVRGDSREGPRIVLIHTLALNQEVWTPVAERLAAAGMQVLTYDCRGHGASTRSTGPFTLDSFARDLGALLDAVGWASAVIVGASMGGSVAQVFAVTYPERVEALGLIDTTAWYGDDAPERWRERAQQALDHGLPSLVDFQLTRWFGDAFRQEHPEVGQHFAEVFVANDVRCYAASCGMLGSLDVRAELARLQVPTAVVVGEQDYATPQVMARQLNESLPGSTLDVLDGARHLTPLERPDDVARILRELIDRRRPTTAETLHLTFRLNGADREADIPVDRMLIDFLREDLSLTGTKEGCAVGVCGLCSVTVDGLLLSACLLPAVFIDGADVRTVEGLADREGQLTPLQHAFIVEGGFQCGICTPGQLMAATALLAEKRSPSEGEIRHWMMGNLCRCTGYEGIVRAIRSVAGVDG